MVRGRLLSVALIALLLVLVAATAAMARSSSERAERLGLSDDQLEQIEALREAAIAPMHSLRDQLREARAEGDSERYEAIRSQLANMRQKMLHLVRSVLTPEELEQMRGEDCVSDEAGSRTLRLYMQHRLMQRRLQSGR